MIFSESIDGNLHAGLTVAGEIADEIALSFSQFYLIAAGFVHFGTRRSFAVGIPSLVHHHHVMNCWVVIELENITGTKTFSFGPTLDVKVPL